MVAMVAWYLGYERHKLTHGEETQNAAQINMAVRCLAANYIISYSPKAKVRSGAWLKPRHGKVNVNFDAGFDVDTLSEQSSDIIMKSSFQPPMKR